MNIYLFTGKHQWDKSLLLNVERMMDIIWSACAEKDFRRLKITEKWYEVLFQDFLGRHERHRTVALRTTHEYFKQLGRVSWNPHFFWLFQTTWDEILKVFVNDYCELAVKLNNIHQQPLLCLTGTKRNKTHFCSCFCWALVNSNTIGSLQTKYHGGKVSPPK